MAQSFLYEELSWPEVREAVAANKVCVIPVGTTEQHGHHLPLAVDNICSGVIALRAVEQCLTVNSQIPQEQRGVKRRLH